MKDIKEQSKIKREFKLTTASLKNKNTIFLLTAVIIFFGLYSFNHLPKELFPEVSFPTIMVQTVYPGNAPVDMENLITRPLEKQIKTVKGLKTLSSNSLQDISMITAEFNTNVDLVEAKKDVQDAVDQAKKDLPADLLTDPAVNDIDFSEFPVININISGDFSLEELRGYAETLQDQVESLPEVSRADIKGVNQHEVQVNVDLIKMQALGLSFFDIENAINAENLSLSGGEVIQGNFQRSVRIQGEFKTIDDLANVIISHEKGNIVYLKDIAQIVNGFKDPTNFARLNRSPVVSLQVVKKSGANVLDATDKVFALMKDAEINHELPKNLDIHYTNDQSEMIRKQLNNLVNSIIMGVLFVSLVLFYFLGTRNALIVGLAIPLSMLTSFIVLSMLGYNINMIILFALILALGMLVDNAIVVVENIYRFISQGQKPMLAAKNAVGEIAVPIIVSTATTLAAFVPLAFWEGNIGEFMKALPITLIIVLTSSLFVALVIIPVFSATFIKLDKDTNRPAQVKNELKWIVVLFILGGLGYLLKKYTIANLLTGLGAIMLMNVLFFYRMGQWFQTKFLPWLENFYIKVLRFSLRGKNPWLLFSGAIFLLIFTMVFYFARGPKVDLFPINEPSTINVYSELPIGSSIYATDSFTLQLEKDIDVFLTPYRDIIKSVLTTVGKGASSRFSTQDEANKAITTIDFVDYQYRRNLNTSKIMADLSLTLGNKYPGVLLTIEKNSMGPPTGKQINLEISGEDFQQLITLTDSIKNYLEKAHIQGIEGLKMDLDVSKPELIVQIDRDRARRFGLSTGQIAQNIRTSLFGKEVTDFKVGEDEYPILLRLGKQYRNSVSSLLNQDIIFKEEGTTYKIPLTSVATIKYASTYGAVNRKDQKRVITLYSNVLEGFNSNAVNQQLDRRMKGFKMPDGFKYSFTGEQEDQKESMAFLSQAMLIAVSLIIILLVTQFNSVVKPIIIMMTVLFSTIGVFGGLATFKMDFVVIMMGIGIVSLAGVVVNNGIVLVDYIELLKARKREAMGLEENAFLPVNEATECVIQAGKTRLRPVLLTAITTILGLLSLAVGFNINFGTLLSNFDPQWYFGGDMVLFWGPISWTVIFGLSFATILTLVLVPVMYRLSILIEKRVRVWFKIEQTY